MSHDLTSKKPSVILCALRVLCGSRVAMLAGALTLSVAACNGAPGPDVASGVQAVSGSEQFAVTGAPAANPLVVLVTDENGNPFSNGKVVWTVSSGGGTVGDSTSTSDASGHTSMTYTAGSNPGVATIVATVASVWTASFTIHIVAPSTIRAR